MEKKTQNLFYYYLMYNIIELVMRGQHSSMPYGSMHILVKPIYFHLLIFVKNTPLD